MPGLNQNQNERGKLPIVSFIGHSNSGKTTLLERVVTELKIKGYRVAVIKHSHHDFDIDQPGKDTWRLSQAGGDVVVGSSPGKVTFMEHVTTEMDLSQIVAMIGNRVDIVLTEGYKGSQTPKVVVANGDGGGESLECKGEILATVPVYFSPLGVPQYDDDTIRCVVDLLMNQISMVASAEYTDINGAVGVFSEYSRERFAELLAEAESVHGHLCPGQVLGVRMAMRGCQELGIVNPKEEKKRLVIYVEIDRCATDAIQVVTGCKLGKRTMKYMDYGKLAATFVDLLTGEAVRVSVRADAREKAVTYHRQEWTKAETQMVAYKAMSDKELFDVERVLMTIPEEDMPGPPRRRVICDECGEEVNDSRDVSVAGRVLCHSCAYGGYYQCYDALVEECYPGVPSA